MDKPPYVTRVVQANMLAQLESRAVKKHVGWSDAPRLFGLLGSRRKPLYKTEDEMVPVNQSDTTIDSEQLAFDIATACNELAYEGYEVVKIIEVLGGNYKYEFRKWEKERSAGGYGLGYSLTDAVILVARFVGEDGGPPPEAEPVT